MLESEIIDRPAEPRLQRLARRYADERNAALDQADPWAWAGLGAILGVTCTLLIMGLAL